ncbi:hypothetical protein L198_05037 [Cryptococcus wingfieldii CBS 7118]|uniref:Cupin-like domain-containing protein n=1 Tax=Cryptococcus wingfieldii CBS 7118 TaxID=1295528 RepID=A0A1E3J240_9TREE|nr:hypothetical protein L198_05037 [Cryptococcus wingfieldii CBS 7118]ODN94186.1 hypothetical protein L198_05037 [Cryptococcus wingfieldii CBS 7118]
MTISHIAIPTACSVSAFTPASLQKHLSTTPILPLHLPNIADAWPALASWSLKDNLRILRDRIGEERVAEIELGKSGRGYLDQEWQKINMPFGRKIFHVVPPAASPHLNPSPKPLHANTSQIPIPVSRIVSPFSESADLDDLPPNTLAECRDRLRRAYELEGGCQVVVGPGESVLIPEGWWHAAEGINGPGVGVGAWFR